MDVMKELDFVNQLYLKDKKPFKKGFVFKCSHCNDRKRRGYVLVDLDKIIIYCHNGGCGINHNLKKYLELYEPSLYEEYLNEEKKEYKEKIQQGIFKKKSNPVKFSQPNTYNLKYIFELSPTYFVLANTNKDCISYCSHRKIPINDLLYCNHPTKFVGGMLIFPFRYQDNYVYGFQGRSINGSKYFYTHSPNESFKIYNIFNVNKSKDVYILESIIDSFHVDNSIAMCGASLSEQVKNMIPYKVFIFDNDETGLKKTIQYIQEGHRVFIWPNDIPKDKKGNPAKDFNELVVKYNWTEQQINGMIKENVKEGIVAYGLIKLKQRGKK